MQIVTNSEMDCYNILAEKQPPPHKKWFIDPYPKRNQNKHRNITILFNTRKVIIFTIYITKDNKLR